jgi:hypothetical protein
MKKIQKKQCLINEVHKNNILLIRVIFFLTPLVWICISHRTRLLHEAVYIVSMIV